MSNPQNNINEIVEPIKEALHLASLSMTGESKKVETTNPLIRVVGGSSKDFWGASVKGVPLRTSGLQGILNYEPSELYITALSGTPLKEVEAALDERGQCLAFEPPNFNSFSTIGGMVASGLSGPARAAAGGARDFVLGLKMINGRAQELVFGGQVIKNVAGYDVSRLLCGSWGTLGVITEVSLKVLPKALCELTFSVEVGQAKAIQLLSNWGQSSLPISASIWSQVNASKPQFGNLFIRLKGAKAAVQTGYQWINKQCAQEKIPVVELDLFESKTLWNSYKNQTADFFLSPPNENDCLWRVSVPPVTPEIKIEAQGTLSPQTWEWNAAQRWLWAPIDLSNDIHTAASRAGGHANLWRVSQRGGIADKEAGVFPSLPGVQQRIQMALQKQFDPSGIFNTRRNQ
jgi:glycolate oxidase FAD binding subunit